MQYAGVQRMRNRVHIDTPSACCGVVYFLVFVGVYFIFHANTFPTIWLSYTLLLVN